MQLKKCVESEQTSVSLSSIIIACRRCACRYFTKKYLYICICHFKNEEFGQEFIMIEWWLSEASTSRAVGKMNWVFSNKRSYLFHWLASSTPTLSVWKLFKETKQPIPHKSWTLFFGFYLLEEEFWEKLHHSGNEIGSKRGHKLSWKRNGLKGDHCVLN